MDKPGVETSDPAWHWLYKIGGAAALLSAAIIPAAIVVYFVWPPPSTVLGFFTLFEYNKLLGLLSLDLLLIIAYALFIPMFLALYVCLRRFSPSFMTLAVGLGFVAVATYFASNTSVNMLLLSDQYALATSEAQRNALLAAGEAALAAYTGTAFHVNYVFGSLTGVIISAIMLRSGVFSKVAAYMGILGNVIAFGLYVPTVGIYISIFSVLFLFVWYILIGLRLFQLGRPEAQGPV